MSSRCKKLVSLVLGDQTIKKVSKNKKDIATSCPEPVVTDAIEAGKQILFFWCVRYDNTIINIVS